MADDIVNQELPDVAKLFRAVSERESVRCGHAVSRHDKNVQLGVAAIILGGVGRELRQQYEHSRAEAITGLQRQGGR